MSSTTENPVTITHLTDAEHTLYQQLKTAADHNTELQHELAERTKRDDSILTRLAALETDNDRLRTGMHNFNVDRNEADERIEELEDDLRKLEEYVWHKFSNTFHTFRTEAREQLAEHEHAISILDQKVADLDSKIEDAEIEQEEMQEQMAQLVKNH